MPVICSVEQKNKKLKTTNMKTRILVFGAVVAAISTLAVSKSKAQGQSPEIRIISTNERDLIKLIYNYETSKAVDVKFTDADGFVKVDKISGKDFKKGFLKKYDVEKMRGNAFWIEITSEELSATYKMVSAKNGKWSAQLEKTTYNYPTVALN
jgi:hypothetical protein